MVRYKAIIFGVLLILVGGSAWYMFNKIESQAITIGEMTQQLEITTSRLSAIELSISDFKQQSSEYSQTEEKSNRELSKRIGTLESNASRGKDAINKKPKLVEKIIQKDYEEFGNRMDCLTLGECK
ncbi:Rz-like spanin [Aeromonas phage CC2]|uniref:Putative membrane protein n=1 Tax=Aeromonas phage CC2 TaxID=1204516 RepID=I6XLQ1_9CAUD|nr:Rz-like spanin [Aeromonas phage CC2]AFN39439.1 putative membrane protein [Aeromonas phage CC2]